MLQNLPFVSRTDSSQAAAVLAVIILLLAVIETSLPILFDKSFSKNYERTAQVEEGIEGFYFSVIANVKKCWFIEQPLFIKARLLKTVIHIGGQNKAVLSLHQLQQRVIDRLWRIFIAVNQDIPAPVGPMLLRRFIGVKSPGVHIPKTVPGGKIRKILFKPPA